jgi:hypothetical protein
MQVAEGGKQGLLYRICSSIFIAQDVDRNAEKEILVQQYQPVEKASKSPR